MFPPGKKDFKAAFRAMKNLIRGHAAAWHAIHDLQADAMASYALYYRGFLSKKQLVAAGRACHQIAERQRE